MADAAVTIRTKKFITNRLLARKQFVCEVLHPGLASVSKAQLKEKLAVMYKVPDSSCVLLYGFKVAYGGGRSTGFGMIYDNIQAAKKYTQKYLLTRFGMGKAKGVARKQRKERKNRMLKQAPRDKAITHLDFDVDPAVADDFAKWLPEYLKELLELPGMLGAKLLSPAPRLAAQHRKPAVVFVLGGPGAGKGTQCAKLVDEFGYKHLSAGDLLRAERQSGSEQGQMIDEFIREGRIVPVEVTVRLLVDAIEADGGSRFLVDGFPRNTNNLSGWHQVVGDKLDTAAVLVYDCPEEVLEERILKRGETSGRTDDNSEAIRKRFRTFRDETMPVIKYYEHQGNLTTIDGTRSVDEVWEDSQLFIADLEQKLKAPPPVAVSAAVFSHVSDKPYIADVSARIAADVRERWGSAVRTQAVEYTVNASLKAYELGSLKAFD